MFRKMKFWIVALSLTFGVMAPALSQTVRKAAPRSDVWVKSVENKAALTVSKSGTTQPQLRKVAVHPSSARQLPVRPAVQAVKREKGSMPQGRENLD
jgi:hypothetical protein